MESGRAACPSAATPVPAIRLAEDSRPQLFPFGLFSWNLSRILAQRKSFRYKIPRLVSFAIFIGRASLF